MRRLALALVLLASAGAAQAQAFGVSMGEPVSRYLGKPTGNGNQYEIKVPQPNDEFEFYLVNATPQAGICSVTGIGRDHKDKSGRTLRASFARLTTTLNERYGSNKTFDFIKPDATNTGANDYHASLYKDEREVATFWDREEKSRMPADLLAIMLAQESVNPQLGYITLKYEFTNLKQCSTSESNNKGL
jgi:hypothetical protein